jgi:hypothetical protein
VIDTQTETPPLGIIDSLSAGFSAVAQMPTLLLISLLLDLFLWLGPRLSITPVVPELATRLRAITGEINANSAELFDQNMVEILGSYNMFSALSTWPLGTPSLLAGNDPGTSPLGTPPSIHVQGLDELLAWLLSLTLAGLLLGSLYLGLIARWASGSHIALRAWLRLAWLYWARIVALVFVVLVGAFFLSVPFFLTMEIVAMILAPLASLMFLVGAGMGMWGLFHLFFAAHGILLDGLSVPQAIGNSVALVRRYRFSAVGLLLVAVVISLGLSTIWNLPPSASWMRLVAIAGNAFTNTGLAAATFIYYRERTPGRESARQQQTPRRAISESENTDMHR